MAPKTKDEKIKKMKENFEKLDKDGDGSLDIDELSGMLKAGNPTFTDEEVKQLYDKCDANGDGRVDFKEFLDYIYRADHTAAGRAARIAATGSVTADNTENDWSTLEPNFKAFAGEDMDGREFEKFCRDCKMYNHKFKKVDVDIIFSKVVPKGKRRMDFKMFQDACRHIAAKRGCNTGAVQQLVMDTTGPKLQGTKADAVRFHDDKSTYTGSHQYNEKVDGLDPTAALGRHEKLQEQHDTYFSKEDDWGPCQKVFSLFAGTSGTLDGREFKKMCEDIQGLVTQKGFTRNDIDIVFVGAAGSAATGSSIGFEEFKKCVRDMAKKKEQDISAVQACIAQSDGPSVNATKAEYNRFHDDKNTYTGASGQAARDGERRC